MGSIASNWKALSGIENNWEGLLDPIDNNLQRYLVHYGERIGAIQDSFNDVEQSDGYGLCRFPKEVFFSRTVLELGNPFKYEVVDYVYARSEIEIGAWKPERSAFIGYVAVGTEEGKGVLGRRDIMICWRGTMLSLEWLKDASMVQILADEVFPQNNAKVHQGFLSVYTAKKDYSIYNKNSAREQVLAIVQGLVDKYTALNEEVSITVAGYSLGAALATLNAMDIVFNGFNKPTTSTTPTIPVTSFVYESPRVGDENFLDLFNSLPNLYLLNIRNTRDLVPTLPPDYGDIKYFEVGVILDISTKDSPDLNLNGFQSHELNLLLYGIAAYQGKGKGFELGFDFNLAIVNKYLDLLKGEYKVPPKWWTSVMNKGLVQIDNGKWKLDDYIPPPPKVMVAKL